MITYQEILKSIAEKNHTTQEKVEASIQEAIDAAFDNPDPEEKAEQERLFGKGHRPTVEEFILTVSAGKFKAMEK